MQQARLMRSETDKMLAGVCGGIATYLGVDSVFVRLAFVLLFFASGVGFVLYLALMILMPSESSVDTPPAKVVQENLEQFGAEFSSGVERVRQHPQGPAIAAGLLILMGFYFLLRNLGYASLGGDVLWPAAIIALGVYLIWRRNRQ